MSGVTVCECYLVVCEARTARNWVARRVPYPLMTAKRAEKGEGLGVFGWEGIRPARKLCERDENQGASVLGLQVPGRQ